VLDHQRADLDCVQQSVLNEDDIDELTWKKMKEASVKGFEKLPQSEQDAIELWVLANVDVHVPEKLIEDRKTDLRKWNMVWKILFPSSQIPPSPCRYFTPYFVYFPDLYSSL
jgi:hypothetical protein